MTFIRNRFTFFLFACILLLCHFPLSAQEAILSSYERNFIRASLSAKSRVLIDAALDERSGEFLASLYNTALSFVLANGAFLRDDPDMIALVATVAKGTAAIGNSSPAAAADSVNKLWGLFQMFNDPYTRVEILGGLANMGRNNRELTGNLNKFLSDETAAFRRANFNNQAANREFPVTLACISALRVLGDGSSFPVLFSAMTSGYPQVIIQESLKAMEAIQGNFKDYLVDIIKNNPFSEKAAAFRIGAYNERFSAPERGELAQAALEVSLESSGPAELALRYDAITVLTRLKWSPAASSAIRNFHKVYSDYSGGVAPRDRLVEAINCLGVMSSSEAAQVLALQLGFINSQTEKTGNYDDAIILAIINSLGELADKAAFDNLLYIGYLNYPDKTKSAAREALARLKW